MRAEESELTLNSNGSFGFLTASSSRFLQHNLGPTCFFYNVNPKERKLEERNPAGNEPLPLKVKSFSTRTASKLAANYSDSKQQLMFKVTALPSTRSLCDKMLLIRFILLLNATFYIYQSTECQLRNFITTFRSSKHYFPA